MVTIAWGAVVDRECGQDWHTWPALERERCAEAVRRARARYPQLLTVVVDGSRCTPAGAGWRLYREVVVR